MVIDASRLAHAKWEVDFHHKLEFRRLKFLTRNFSSLLFKEEGVVVGRSPGMVNGTLQFRQSEQSNVSADQKQVERVAVSLVLQPTDFGVVEEQRGRTSLVKHVDVLKGDLQRVSVVRSCTRQYIERKLFVIVGHCSMESGSIHIPIVQFSS